MLGDERIDFDKNDDIIIDGKRYAGTRGLYELIFGKFPDEKIYTNADKESYLKILLATNAHRRGHNVHERVKSNKGHKHMNIIGPLVLGNKVGKGMPCAVTLKDNKVDYVHLVNVIDFIDSASL